MQKQNLNSKRSNKKSWIQSLFMVALVTTLVGNVQPSQAEMDFEYSGQVRARFPDLDKFPGKGDGIHVVMKVQPNGTFKVLGVGNADNPQPAASRFVYDTVTAVSSFPPLPAGQQDKPYAWMVFSWDNLGEHKSSAVSGPYFDDSIMDSLQYDIGMKKRSYTDNIEHRISKVAKLSGVADAAVQLKLTPQGTIDKILISCSDPSKVKLVYDAVGKAQPFGPIPASCKTTPFFFVKMSWKYQESNGSSWGGGMSKTDAQHVTTFPIKSK